MSLQYFHTRLGPESKNCHITKGIWDGVTRYDIEQVLGISKASYGRSKIDFIIIPQCVSTHLKYQYSQYYLVFAQQLVPSIVKFRI